MRLLFYFLLLFASGLNAQQDYPSLSPLVESTQVIGNTTIELRYERPATRDREIFGTLVPWNKVWRTGAAYATTIAFDQPLSLGGQLVAPGKYTLLSIPNPEEWIVIINTDTTLYGSHKYQSDLDVARFRAPATKSHRHYESLSLSIDFVPNNGVFYINWTDVQVAFPVKTLTDDTALDYIDNNLNTFISKDAQEYAMAADYLQFNNINLRQAIVLAQKSLELDPTQTWAYGTIIKANKRLGYFKVAESTVEAAIEFRKQHPFDDPKEQEQELNYWKSFLE